MKNYLGWKVKRFLNYLKFPILFRRNIQTKQKIRLRDFEVKMVNLKKILSIQGGEPKGEIRILAVKGQWGI